jgi:23S rRNA (guanosine2251-2'-O)-methyltransferase
MAKNYMYLYGRNSVIERLRAHPESVRRVTVREGLSVPELETLVRLRGVDLERVPAAKLERMRPQKDLQGVVARVDLFRYASPEDLVAGAIADKRSIVLLDRVNDPHNLGVVLRLAACFGRFAIVIPNREACQVNETVLHVASGGENYVPVANVDDLVAALDAAKESGFHAAGAVVGEDAEDISNYSFPSPLAVVLGSEGGGIAGALRKRLDARVRIPMPGARLSLNVATACAVFLYEVSRQLNTTT